ncbi:MAG: hypothetical protein NVS4B8_10480 [Herpetosiphon sp.]
MKRRCPYHHLVLAASFLVACGGSPAPIAVQPTALSTPTMVPTATEVPQPTATVVPTPTLTASSTPVPTMSPTPVATQTPLVVLGDEQSLDGAGYRMRPALGWAVQPLGGIAIVQPAEGDPRSKPYFLADAGTASDFGLTGDEPALSTPDGLLDTLLKLLGDRTGTRPDVIDRKPITVDGQTGLAANLRGTNSDVAVEGRIVVVRIGQKRLFAALGFAPREQWSATLPKFEAMVNSVRFFEPVTIPTITPSTGG